MRSPRSPRASTLNYGKQIKRKLYKTKHWVFFSWFPKRKLRVGIALQTAFSQRDKMKWCNESVWGPLLQLEHADLLTPWFCDLIPVLPAQKTAIQSKNLQPSKKWFSSLPSAQVRTADTIPESNYASYSNKSWSYLPWWRNWSMKGPPYKILEYTNICKLTSEGTAWCYSNIQIF